MELTILAKAYDRAVASVSTNQDTVAELIRQIGNVEAEARDPAGAICLIANGSHNAGFHIAVVVATDGQIGWSLV